MPSFARHLALFLALAVPSAALSPQAVGANSMQSCAYEALTMPVDTTVQCASPYRARRLDLSTAVGWNDRTGEYVYVRSYSYLVTPSYWLRF